MIFRWRRWLGRAEQPEGQRRLEPGQLLELFGSPFYRQAIRHSLEIAGWSSLLGLLIAVLGSHSLRHVDSRLRDFVMAFSNMTSNFAGVPLAFAFIILLGFNGALTLCCSRPAGSTTSISTRRPA